MDYGKANHTIHTTIPFVTYFSDHSLICYVIVLPEEIVMSDEMSIVFTTCCVCVRSLVR